MEIIGNRIRLSFRSNGRQLAFHPGLGDTDSDRAKAALIAKQIEIDLLSDKLDPSFTRYKVGASGKATCQTPQTVASLFTDFIAWKEEQVYSRTLAKYRSLLARIKQSGLGDVTASTLTSKEAKQLCEFLKESCEARTLKERLQLLAACWDWGKLENNHWKVGSY